MLGGGGLVPDTPDNSAISTTVAGLKLSQFLGASNVIPNPAYLEPMAVAAGGYTMDGSPSQANVTFSSDGTCTVLLNEYGMVSIIREFNWLNSASANDYRIRITGLATSGSGYKQTPANDAWVTAGPTTPVVFEAYCQGGRADNALIQGTIQIAKATDLTNILASASLSLSAIIMS